MGTTQDHHHTPHVAMLPCPGMGHLVPHLELAKPSAAQSQYLLSNSLPESLQIYHLPPKNIAPSVENSASLEIRLSSIIRESLPEIESFIVNSHDSKDTAVSPISILITDFFSTDGFDIANKVGIPKYIYFCPAAYIFSFMILSISKIQFKTPGCKPIQPNDLPDPLWDRKTGAYKWFLNQASRFPLADGILLNTSRDIEPNTIQSLRDNPILQQLGTPRIYPVGPLVKPQLAKLNDEYLTWLNQQPKDSVLYVSFGS
ncbi:hypothetical protein MKW98_026571, partial [Papaver atlanticum]